MALLNAADECRREGGLDEALSLICSAKNSSEASYNLLENLLNWVQSQLNAVSIRPCNVKRCPLFEEIKQLVKVHAQNNSKKFTLKCRQIYASRWNHYRSK